MPHGPVDWPSSSKAGTTPEALRTSVAATLGALLDVPHGAEAPTSGGPGREAVGTTKRARDNAIDTLGTGESDRRGPVVSAVTYDRGWATTARLTRNPR